MIITSLYSSVDFKSDHIFSGNKKVSKNHFELFKKKVKKKFVNTLLNTVTVYKVIRIYF